MKKMKRCNKNNMEDGKMYKIQYNYFDNKGNGKTKIKECKTIKSMRNFIIKSKDNLDCFEITHLNFDENLIKDL